jgi:hypothetical protein
LTVGSVRVTKSEVRFMASKYSPLSPVPVPVHAATAVTGILASAVAPLLSVARARSVWPPAARLTVQEYGAVVSVLTEAPSTKS